MELNASISEHLGFLPECCICMSAMMGNLAALPVCGHVFHQDCIVKWQKLKPNALSAPLCPLCRAAWGGRQPVPLSYSIEEEALRQFIEDPMDDDDEQLRPASQCADDSDATVILFDETEGCDEPKEAEAAAVPPRGIIEQAKPAAPRRKRMCCVLNNRRIVELEDQIEELNAKISELKQAVGASAETAEKHKQSFLQWKTYASEQKTKRQKLKAEVERYKGELLDLKKRINLTEIVTSGKYSDYVRQGGTTSEEGEIFADDKQRVEFLHSVVGAFASRFTAAQQREAAKAHEVEELKTIIQKQRDTMRAQQEKLEGLETTNTKAAETIAGLRTAASRRNELARENILLRQQLSNYGISTNPVSSANATVLSVPQSINPFKLPQYEKPKPSPDLDLAVDVESISLPDVQVSGSKRPRPHIPVDNGDSRKAAVAYTDCTDVDQLSVSSYDDLLEENIPPPSQLAPTARKPDRKHKSATKTRQLGAKSRNFVRTSFQVPITTSFALARAASATFR